MKPPSLNIKGLITRRNPHFSLFVDRLQLQPGTTLCITGPNGSGKSTLVENIVGLLQPQAGSIAISGVAIEDNLQDTKTLIGYVPDDESWFIKELCAKEYFNLLCTVYQDDKLTAKMEARIRYLAKRLLFTNFHAPLALLSHGNKKKVQLIAALLHSPSIIVIDELRNGLDPIAIAAAESLLQEEIDRGATIITATHDLWWAERTAKEIVLLVGGKIIVHQTTAAIVHHYGSLEKAFTELLNEHS